MSEQIQLTEFISKIKEDLKQAQQDSKVFLIDKVELEIQVTATRKGAVEGTGEGEIDLQINVVPCLPPVKVGKAKASVTGSGELTQENIHTIKVSLSPAILNKEFMNMLKPEQKEKLQEESEELLWLGGDKSKKNKFQ